ncbi:MAG: histidinol-phosphatase [Desulfovibrio sp.]|nr:histidinol-phosphatase [Desulfovibrio sp.]
MIQADTHLHTCYSHGASTPAEMYAAALAKGLALIGFSEHSPRPEGYNYTHEYRERLARCLPLYIREVEALKKRNEGLKVLLGLEMDWLDGEETFIRASISANDYDYVIGSVHFLGSWGFDDGPEAWRGISQAECENRYGQYFHTWQKMLKSGLFQIAAHPDLIKIFSIGQFRIWIQKPEALALVRNCLLSLRDAGMAMEVSSAGLRKACQEIYPCPQIMTLAASLGIPVSLASDAHCVRDIGADFDQLASYAASFGYREQTVFDRGMKLSLPF